MHSDSPRTLAQRAFSLVELSIVLVILGLLIGGILSGQALIRAAELRSVSTEYARYATAVQTFRDKYFALPEDMSNATAFWNTGTCPGTSAQPSTTSATCNGDGNGRVDMNGPTNPTRNEVFRFWQHLANAGLIEGQYSGVTGDSGGYFAGGSTNNMPRSKLSNAVWFTFSENNTAGTSNGLFFAYDLHLDFLFGGYVAADWPWRAILKSEEAWNIDTKLDDGQPGRGRVLSRVGGNCTSAANNLDYAATYLLTQTGTNCHLNFISN
jgi:prepilin-type N-terminal cleavage/methylation domain-containing protein